MTSVRSVHLNGITCRSAAAFHAAQQTNSVRSWAMDVAFVEEQGDFPICRVRGVRGMDGIIRHTCAESRA